MSGSLLSRLGDVAWALVACLIAIAVYDAIAPGNDPTNPALERDIATLTRTAATIRVRAREIQKVSDHATAVAQLATARYEDARRAVSIDFASGIVTGPSITPTTLPPAVLTIVQRCDAAIPALHTALDTTRAGWALERQASDTQLVADSLKDLREVPSRCGFKCGIAVGAGVTLAGVLLAVKVIRAVARPSPLTSAIPGPGR